MSENVLIDDNYNLNSKIVVYLDYALNVLEKLPDGLAKLVITSPPYNLAKSYETKASIEQYLEAQELIIQELIRIVDVSGSICWEVGNYVNNGEVFPLDIFYYQIFKKHGLHLRNRIIWHFEHGLHASKRFSGRYETILWFTKSDKYTFNLDSVRVPSKYPGKRYYKGKKKGQPSSNPLGKNPSDVWQIVSQDWENEIWEIPNVKANHPEKTIHPCQFPIELAERCVLALTNENDWVLDPFMGVGSSLIAALKNGRKAIGIDKEPEYVDIAKQRIIALYNGTLKFRPLDKPIYTPSGREKISQPPEEWNNLTAHQPKEVNHR